MIGVLLADGFEEVEALGTVDILRRCGEDVRLVRVSSTESSEKQAIGGHDIKVECDMSVNDTEDFKNLEEADVIALPGGLVGVNNLKASSKVKELLDKRNEEGKWIAAICAAPTLLAEYGYLNGKAAVCYPGMEDQLTGAVIGADKAVVHENIITSQAAGTTHKFAQAIMKALGKEDKCKEVISGMHY